MISYAQNFEDVILARALSDRANGFYVDIGACFPDAASVTRHFYELGWNGVNVEPMVEPFERLQAERARDINVRAAVASFTGEIPIYHGSSVGESSAVRPFDTARPILVPCLTLADLCRRYVTRPIDFLKIDVEGLEHDVVKGGDWERYRPVVVVLEVTIPWSTQRRADASEIAQFLRDKGYDEVYFDGLNAFFLAREATSLALRFAAPPNVLDRFTVAREAELEVATARLQAHADAVGRRLSEIEAHASAKEGESTALAARAIVAEALAQQSERAHAELQKALHEKERLLLNAQRAWQDGVATVERLQVTVAKATSELQAAELRTRELTQALAEAAKRAESAAREANAAIAAAGAAEARAQAADDKALQEVLRAQHALADAAQAEARTQEADTRAHQAEARAQRAEALALRAEEQAEIHVQQADARAHLAEAFALRAEGMARNLEARERESAAGEHRAVARALQAEDTIASMLCSRSWRVTAPLRALADLVRGGPRGAPAPAAPARRVALSAARANALRRVRSLARRTALYHWAAPRLKQRYPNFWMRAKVLALENPAPARGPAPSPADSHTPTSAGARAADERSDASGDHRLHALPAEATIEDLTSCIQREIARRRAS